MRQYTLLGPDGPFLSDTPGQLGGNGLAKIYGRLDCGAALRALRQGDAYARNRVFFADAKTARACGYRPCGGCMRREYKEWKAEQTA